MLIRSALMAGRPATRGPTDSLPQSRACAAPRRAWLPPATLPYSKLGPLVDEGTNRFSRLVPLVFTPLRGCGGLQSPISNMLTFEIDLISRRVAQARDHLPANKPE